MYAKPLSRAFKCLQDLEMPAALKEADSTREAQLLESWKAYKKGFQEGISIFNQKPKKGVAFMQVCCYSRAQSTQAAAELHALLMYTSKKAWQV